MDEGFNRITAESVKSREQAAELMEKLLAVAQPGTVYSTPLTAGDYTVITATEASVGLGVGFGIGGGPAAQSGAEGQVAAGESPMGAGGGGGGGGVSMARPVAVISISPNGIEIEPIVDATKIAMALFTAVGTMFVMLNRMRRNARG